MMRVVEYIVRRLLIIIVAVSILGFLPAKAQADTNPIDLVLGGEGAASWNISNVKPSDSGTKIVELHNAGSGDGFVTVWISDLVSGEGLNPESETGNTAEPGEFADYLLLDLTAEGLNSNINFPAAIGNLPRNNAGPDYIEIIPLKSGDTVFLRWDWQIPAQANNDLQGDNVTYTINYLLREINITDVSGSVNEIGLFTENVIVESKIGKGTITIEENTIGQTAGGVPVSEVWLIDVNREAAALPGNSAAVALYDAGPDGTTFDRPVTLTFSYDDPEDIPAGVAEEDLYIVLWDEGTGQWVELEGSVVDTVNNIISARVSSFSKYAIIVPLPPPPPSFDEGGEPPPPPAIPPPVTLPPTGELPPMPVDQVPVATTTLETSMLGDEKKFEISTEGLVLEPLSLADPDGHFTVALDSGTRIITGDGTVPSRFELTIAAEPVIPADKMAVIDGKVVLDNRVLLSPIYRFTSYVNGVVTPVTYFDPAATLVVRYDTDNLPENILTPFVAYYTAEQGLMPIEPPPGSTFEIGRAKARIGHASLFVVAAELLPPPPPLPARFEVGDLRISSGQVEPGQPVIISLSVANEGEIEGSYELYLKIDGIVKMIKRVTLAARDSQTISFEISDIAIGKHKISVAGLTGQFSVTSSTPVTILSTVNWLIFDLGIAAVVAAGLLALYLVRRRKL